MITLYNHNLKTYYLIQKAFEKHKKVGFIQPTGSGKSFVFLKWIEDHKEDTIIFLAPSCEIISQLRSYAEESGDSHILNNTTFITYQSLNYMTAEEIKKIVADKIMLDEFHRIGAEKWGRAVTLLMENNSNALILGASATPIRYLDNSRDMGEVLFDIIANEITLGEAVMLGILPTPQYVPVWYDIDGNLARYQEELKIGNNAENRKELENKLQWAKHNLENAYGIKKMINNYVCETHGKYIVFFKSIEHIESIIPVVKTWFSDINTNINCYISTYIQKDNDVQLEKFRTDNSKSIKLLFTVDRLNEGVHVKDISGVLLLRPTISPIIYLQQIGRTLACSNKSKSPVIFDFVNNYHSVRIIYNNTEINIIQHELMEASLKYPAAETFYLFEDSVQFTRMIEELEDILYPANNHIWTKKFDLYKEFKNKFSREPLDKERYQGINLGEWCRHQRRNYINQTLHPERENLLINAGFCFDSPFNIKWLHMYELYIQFKEQYHREPSLREKYMDYAIGKWCSVQRQKYNKQTLPENRIKQLEKVGFSFYSPVQIHWQNMADLLEKFILENNRMPRSKEQYQGQALGAWLLTQRSQYKKGLLSQKRIQVLKQIGVKL